jgi:hypothetical protein
VTTRGGSSRPVGKPGDRPAPKGHPPRGAKAALRGQTRGQTWVSTRRKSGALGHSGQSPVCAF